MPAVPTPGAGRLALQLSSTATNRTPLFSHSRLAKCYVPGQLSSAIKEVNLFGDVRFRYEYRGAETVEG